MFLFIYTDKFVPLFLYAFIMLIFQIKRIFQVKNGLTTLLLCFSLKMPKIWVSRTMLNGEKKEDGLRREEIEWTKLFHKGILHCGCTRNET